MPKTRFYTSWIRKRASNIGYNRRSLGEVSELVDERDLGSRAERRPGSSPGFPTSTMLQQKSHWRSCNEVRECSPVFLGSSRLHQGAQAILFSKVPERPTMLENWASPESWTAF